VLSVIKFDRIKIDDPVGAIGVHGLCGAAGTILVGVFATDGGLLYGGGAQLLLIQILGVVAVAAWVAVTMGVVFTVIRKTIGLRVSAEEEIDGLDIHEHGLVSSYADFMLLSGPAGDLPVPANAPFPLAVAGSPASGEAPVSKPVGAVKMTHVTVILKQNKFEAFKAAMNEIGITGMTVTNVLGYGQQKGAPEYYRGAVVETSVLPKVKVDIVVSKVPVRTVIETAKKVLYTGHIGDGKIFVYDVENVVRVRTGEEGYDALQDDLAAEKITAD
jgi:Amt family ammonium transporter